MRTQRVAICQPYFILGGRLSLVLGMVKSLNSLGIEPDILSLGCAFQPEAIQEKYGRDLRMNFRTIAGFLPWRWLPQDYQILVFNRQLKKIGREYDLLINSSNSQIYLPKNPCVLSYIHFPREYRIRKGAALGYAEGSKSLNTTFFKLSDSILRSIYAHVSIQPGHSIVCNSNYSRECFLSVFPDFKEEIPVIYPPVKMADYQGEINREREGVVTLGRFAANKMQLEQIKIAEKLPGIHFNIVGFVNDKTYYNRCQEYIVNHRLNNVQLHPNLDFDAMIRLLNTSKYFLHTLVNEPFGITAVEAIAAGCLPLVHDSGGQKETVPFAELRYSSLEAIPATLAALEKKSMDEVHDIIFALQSNAHQKFDEPVFEQKFTSLMETLLEQSAVK